MEQTELTYFDKSRRTFLQLTGLSLTGCFLPGVVWGPSPAKAGPVPMRVDEAVARALEDAGAKVVTHVPATGAVTLFDTHARLTGATPCYAFNEEVAYTMAHGAALAGARSAAIIKSHGLAKAGNSVIDSITLGTTAGFVAIVIDDPSGRHSDTVFDCESFLKGTGMPFKKAARETIYGALIECFLWSEEIGIPVALFVDTALVFSETACERRRLRPLAASYKRDPLRHVLCPPLAGYQQKVLNAKFARTDWRAVAAPALPAVPEGLPPAWREAASQYVPLFEVFEALRPEIPFVCGDTGLSSLFAFAPFACVDACSYYGGSIPLAIGFQLAGFGRAWAVTGDYAFLAAGHMGLIEALARRIPLKVLVMDNGRAMATGGQPIPAGLLEQVLNGWGASVSRIENPRDKAAVRSTLTRVLRTDRLEIVAARFRS